MESSETTTKDSIRKVVYDFVETWNRHDAHAFASVFAEESYFSNVVGMTAKGRQGIESFHAPAFETVFKNSHQAVEDINIRLVNPSIASVDLLWSMTGALDRAGNPRPLRKGLINFFMTKEDDKWLVKMMHNIEFPAASPEH
jgi:uncharacterized protein (TIGR02246 family)